MLNAQLHAAQLTTTSWLEQRLSLLSVFLNMCICAILIATRQSMVAEHFSVAPWGRHDDAYLRSVGVEVRSRL